VVTLRGGAVRSSVASAVADGGPELLQVLSGGLSGAATSGQCRWAEFRNEIRWLTFSPVLANA
jgi:hypothetical protein